jgi:hypothetical protein
MLSGIQPCMMRNLEHTLNNINYRWKYTPFVPQKTNTTKYTPSVPQKIYQLCQNLDVFIH